MREKRRHERVVGTVVGWLASYDIPVLQRWPIWAVIALAILSVVAIVLFSIGMAWLWGQIIDALMGIGDPY